MERTFYSSSPAQTEEIASSLAHELCGLIAFYGRMGAGKTAFIRGFVGALNPSARVSSPTYTVVNSYSETLYHLDLYRIENEEDLESVGFYDIPKDATILCEWSENLPEDVRIDAKIFIEQSEEDDTRIIKVVN